MQPVGGTSEIAAWGYAHARDAMTCLLVPRPALHGGPLAARVSERDVGADHDMTGLAWGASLM